MLSTTPTLSLPKIQLKPISTLRLIQLNESLSEPPLEHSVSEKENTDIDLKKQRLKEIFEIRYILLEKSYDCKLEWARLQSFIIQYYPKRYHFLILSLIGSDNSPIHSKNDMHELEKIFRQGLNFIKENESVMSVSDFLPHDFCKDYKRKYCFFMKAYKSYCHKIEENKRLVRPHQHENELQLKVVV